MLNDKLCLYDCCHGQKICTERNSTSLQEQKCAFSSSCRTWICRHRYNKTTLREDIRKAVVLLETYRFSKLTRWAVPTFETTFAKIINFLLNICLSLVGVPPSVLTNNVPRFVNKFISSISKYLSPKHLPNTAYCLQTNGQPSGMTLKCSRDFTATRTIKGNGTYFYNHWCTRTILRYTEAPILLRSALF